MRKKIFISYRRADTASESDRIYGRLAARYGKKNVFKDIDSIPLGVDFEQYIDEVIPQCACMLVVIGRTWPAPDAATGKPRIYAPNDLVRREIARRTNASAPQRSAVEVGKAGETGTDGRAV